MNYFKQAWVKVQDLAVGTKIAVPRTQAISRHWPSVSKNEAVSRLYPRCRGLDTPQPHYDDYTDSVDDLEWDEIVSIKKVGEERVWDIEVEGTHNFVAGHLLNTKTGDKLTEEQEKAVLSGKQSNSNIVSDFGFRISDLIFGGIFAHNTYLGHNATIKGQVLPNADSAYDLGTSALRWDALYVGSINAEGNIVPTVTGNYNLGSSSLHWNALYVDSITTYGAILPGTDSSYNLGSNTVRWLNIFADSLETSTLVTSGHIYPTADDTYDLGTSSLKWRNIYAHTIDLDFTSGSVLFIDNDGQITQDNSQLFWNNNDNQLGIGTTTPAGPLQVGTDPYLLVDTTGQVGIGATPTNSKLLITQGGDAIALKIDSQSATTNVITIEAPLLSTGSVLNLENTSSNTSARSLLNIVNYDTLATGAIPLRIQQKSTGDIVNMFSGSTEVFTILSGGNVGINATAPTSFKLQVAGNVGPNTDSAYDLGTSALRWDALYVGSVNAEGNIVPTYTGNYNLGSSSLRWNALYVDSITTYGAILPGTDSAYNLGADATRWLNVFSDSVETTTFVVASAGSAQIPVGTGPTVDLSGEIAIDTTSDQLVFYGAAAKRVLTYQENKTVTLESPADTDNFNLFKAPYNLTITDIECIIDPADTAESVVIDLQERDSAGDNPATVDATITCDNDGASDDGSLSNGPIDSGDWVSLDIGVVTGTVTQLTVTVTYTVDAQ